MKNRNQYSSENEIIKHADVRIISNDNNNDDEAALVSKLKNEISNLKSTNAYLSINLQNLRERCLPYVLLVDDNYDTIQIITDILSNEYNVIDTGNGVEALSMIRTMGNTGSSIKRIDAVLLDLNLPGMSGISLCREIKKRLKINVPVIICTARQMKKDVIDAISSGADDYIVKPFEENALLEKLNKWVRK
ncbi:MAG: response regulator transcription factor [Candidatus Scalindua sp.]|jgi:CheY-like chemotaxis protein|nr:response regulator transcription factor [Candidatus Scalindua sp.]MBT7590321.1 response regulator transcription factor [Candidatus Scalindua sp.]